MCSAHGRKMNEAPNKKGGVEKLIVSRLLYMCFNILLRSR